MLTAIIILAVIGFCISLYTYTVERKIKENLAYKPVCDISDRISCTKPMMSTYANLFFFSNAIVGMTYYILVVILAYFNQTNLLLLAAIAACIFSLILAYLLYFKIQSFCILCTSLYIVNFLILALIIYEIYG